jgi:hypothetical protein
VSFICARIAARDTGVVSLLDPTCYFASCMSPGSADSYCERCGVFFCIICKKHHQSLKETIDEIIKKNSAQDGLLRMKARRQGICETMQLRYVSASISIYFSYILLLFNTYWKQILLVLVKRIIAENKTKHFSLRCSLFIHY